MPANIVKSLAKKSKKTVEEVEKKWDKAKKIAKEEGEENNYAYITGILKKMLKIKSFNERYEEIISSLITEAMTRKEWTSIGPDNIIKKFAELLDKHDEDYVKEKFKNAQLIAQKIGKENDWASVRNITAKSLGIPIPPPQQYVNIKKNNANSFTIKLDTKHIDFVSKLQLGRLLEMIGAKISIDDILRKDNGEIISIESDEALSDKIAGYVKQSKIDPQQSLPGF